MPLGDHAHIGLLSAGICKVVRLGHVIFRQGSHDAALTDSLHKVNRITTSFWWFHIRTARHIAPVLAAALALAMAGLLAGCCCARGGSVMYSRVVPPGAPPRAVPPPGAAAPDTSTLVAMQSVHFRVDPHLPLQIRRLVGRMEPLPDFEVIDFGDSQSFVIEIAEAEVGLTPENLRYLFNEYVFDYPGAPLTLDAMSTEDGYLVQRGTLRKVVAIPFEMKSEMSVTEDGRIRISPVEMQICGIPGQGLMEALGIELEDLLDLSEAPGMAVEGNDLLADPAAFLPPPAIRGRITGVRIEEDLVVQIFDSGERIVVPPPGRPEAANYMFFAGGTLAFGKLFMVESDLQIVDDDPDDPFDFFLQRYMDQLVAGRSETMPDAGLVAFFPDFHDLQPASEGRAEEAARAASH